MIYWVKIGFLEIGIGDVLDVLLVSVLIYQFYKLLRGTLAFNIFIGLLLVYLMTYIARALNMNMIAGILGQFSGAGFILLVIVFQQEIRRFLFYLGRGSGIGKNRFWQRLFNRPSASNTEKQHIKEEIERAIVRMANFKTGALIVFADPAEKRYFVDTGVRIDSEITTKLIESIFDKNTPLHDGAMVISDNRIYSAACVLPVSDNPDLPTHIGMRHRAAVGITEVIGADVLVVSEETGKISHAVKGNLYTQISKNTLSRLLDELLGIQAAREE